MNIIEYIIQKLIVYVRLKLSATLDEAVQAFYRGNNPERAAPVAADQFVDLTDSEIDDLQLAIPPIGALPHDAWVIANNSIGIVIYLQ